MNCSNKMSNNRRLQQKKQSASGHPSDATPSNSTSQSSASSASPKTTPPQKTQPIRKQRKKQQTSQAQSTGSLSPVQLRLVQRAVERLQEWLGDEPLDHIDMLGFLQTIQGEYARTANHYLKKQTPSQAGTLMPMLKTFVEKLVQQFPQLITHLAHYNQQYYGQGVLQSRFKRLIDQNITPILKAMSEEQMKEQVEKKEQKREEGGKQIQTDTTLSKRNRKKAKKKGLKKIEKAESESDKEVQKLIGFLEGMKIVQADRIDCHVTQQKIAQWTNRFNDLRKK